VLNRRSYLEMWAGDTSIVPQLAMKSLGLLDGLDEPVEQGRAHGFAGVLIANSTGARRRPPAHPGSSRADPGRR